MPVSKILEANLAVLEKDKSKTLGVVMGNTTVSEPGQYIPRADAQDNPKLSFNAPLEKKYIAFCIDPDAPFAAFPILGPILHWFQSGLQTTNQQTENSDNTLISQDKVIAFYGPPGPPPGSKPHRYVFFLYEQPANFDVKDHLPVGENGISRLQRMRYDFDGVVKDLGLGEVVAVNYFTSN